MFCKKCGTDNGRNMNSCKKCGAALYDEAVETDSPNNSGRRDSLQNGEPPKNKNKNHMMDIIFGVVAVLVVAAAVIVLVFYTKNKNNTEDENSGNQTASTISENASGDNDILISTDGNGNDIPGTSTPDGFYDDTNNPTDGTFPTGSGGNNNNTGGSNNGNTGGGNTGGNSGGSTGGNTSGNNNGNSGGNTGGSEKPESTTNPPETTTNKPLDIGNGGSGGSLSWNDF